MSNKGHGWQPPSDVILKKVPTPQQLPPKLVITVVVSCDDKEPGQEVVDALDFLPVVTAICSCKNNLYIY
jgi:hypothetical protein